MSQPSASAPPRTPLWADDAPVRIGISSCLLGEPVRWDGGHKRDAFLTRVLEPFVEWVPVCPEVEAGMGVPREPVHLVHDDDGVVMVGTRSGLDHTDAMRRWSRRRVAELLAEDLCGYVLKKDSPSCGMERVKVRSPRGGPGRREGRGLFAEALIAADPWLPVEEEGRLNDPVLRESWIERVFAFRRLRTFFGRRWSVGDLVRFHTAHKLQLLAHAPAAYRELGRLVAGARDLRRDELERRYREGFMGALGRRATRARHQNVLEHAIGHFKKRLDPEVRAEMLRHVRDYREGLVPLVVPLTLIRHYVERLPVEYLAEQVYLEPHPKELMLRNHV
ncbi:MAG: DUF523 and DUF1722 domain-containing protein [Myxococcota bacterium]|nr:DUF523 and DUF1722 domain-containing protein [Myxococcota bacterium]